ncbi:MAG: cupin domain-containing protein [Deltaproteobacteria bacterium]|nr:cupin domain-containing protein [Deltaproteobacteria bacterium]
MALNRGLRENIRRLRKDKGLTLNEMAGICNCSSGLLSQIETGAVNPSLATMQSIANVLGVPVGELFAEHPKGQVVPPILTEPRERKLLILEGGVRFQLLSRSIDVPFEYILTTWPPKTSTGKALHIHEGEECGLLLEGELHVETDGKIYHMKPGDSITLSSQTPHRVTNPGEKKAVSVWVNSIPWRFSTK